MLHIIGLESQSFINRFCFSHSLLLISSVRRKKKKMLPPITLLFISAISCGLEELVEHRNENLSTLVFSC